MRRYYAVVSVALFAIAGLLLATAAKAAPPSPEVEADYAAAVALEGGPTQCASVTLEMLPTDPFSDQDGVHAAMRATQPRPGEAEIACHLYVFEDALAEVRAMWGTGAACVIELETRHEVGHLRGEGHSEDPANIMHAPPSVASCSPSAIAPSLVPAAPYVEAPWSAAERQRSWRVYRQIRRSCRHLRGPYRAKCYREARSLARWIRSGL